MKRVWSAYILCVAAASIMTIRASAQTSNEALWNKFESLRQGPQVLHQEFEATSKVTSGYIEEVSRQHVTVDLAEGKWREQTAGTRERIRIYDGKDLSEMEPDGTEFTRLTVTVSKEWTLPAPYENMLDWRKAKQLQSFPCGFSGKDHACAIIEAPLKPWIRPATPGNVIKITDGTARVMVDTETGIWLRCEVAETVDTSRGTNTWELTYSVKQMTYGAAPDVALFRLPEGLHLVGELSPWDEGRLRKELVGKPAPDFQLKDMKGAPISLANLKGKTVLLDFWATWCPPCQADASSIEKLNQKYGNGNLAIIGISVGEERAIVEKYLKKHQHSYPVVLSIDNEMPRAYQVGVFPTYMVISPDGTLTTARQGDQGFANLRRDLEKAGMSAE
jgi:thiol-disulfide isomerase/thioredoxin